PTNIMQDRNSQDGMLADVGVNPNTTFLALGLAVNSDGGVIAEIDNFRVIVPIDLTADFDNDGDVDGDDLTMWEGGFGNSDAGDADGDGDSDGADFLA